MPKDINPKRVSVFIDHSNVIHRLLEIREIDPQWIKWYDPYKLAIRLKGNRQLVGVHFYCTPPPAYLLTNGKRSQERYWKQMNYYEAIKKIKEVQVKYGTLKGERGKLREKNLDTQLNTDLLLKSFANEFDTAILVANDGDYVAAVEGVKQLGRKIELVFFKRRLSMELKGICDISRRARRSFFEPLDFIVQDSSGK